MLCVPPPLALVCSPVILYSRGVPGRVSWSNLCQGLAEPCITECNGRAEPSAGGLGATCRLGLRGARGCRPAPQRCLLTSFLSPLDLPWQRTAAGVVRADWAERHFHKLSSSHIMDWLQICYRVDQCHTGNLRIMMRINYPELIQISYFDQISICMTVYY